MLALARKENESIVINDNIEITILEVKGDQVKPRSVPIYRKEIYTQIQDSNRDAANGAGADPSVLSKLI